MFRFTIREMVLLTLVVAMGLGWWLEHRQLADAQKWRNIAGGLEHLIKQQGYRVGVLDGRLWLAPVASYPLRINDVGQDQFEPTLGTDRQDELPLEPYYDKWIRTGP